MRFASIYDDRIVATTSLPQLAGDHTAATRRSTVVRRTQASRRADSERALLDAAATLFAQRGIDGTSLAEIGELAGYSRAHANHHFGTKAVLIQRLLERCQSSFVALLDPPPGASSLEAVQAIADTYVRRVEQPAPGDRAFLVMWGASFPADHQVAAIRDADRRVRDQVEQYVRAGQVDGSISAGVDAAAFSMVFIGLIRGIAGLLLTNTSDVDNDALRMQLRAVIDASLRPKGS